MSQILTAENTGQHVMTVIIRTVDEGPGTSILLALPHGLYLPSGIAFQVDSGKSNSAPIQTSDAKGVYAVFPLSQAQFEAMKAGNRLKVSMQSVKRETITLAVSLLGFTAASKKILSAQ